MYRKILSFMLILCLCMGMMPNANVYAAENQEDVEGLFIASMETDEQSVYEETEIEIPQNGSEVHMEDVIAAQPVTFRLPPEDEEKSSNKRYTVLLLDVSCSVTFNDVNGSVLYTADTAFPYVCASSKKFIEDIGTASGKNYIAIVAFSGDTSQVVSPFTDDVDALLNAMGSLGISPGYSNVHSGLTAAEELIDSVSDQSGTKNVVLFTTGMTATGTYSYKGPYNTLTVGGRWYNPGTNIPLYAYANAAYAAAEKLKRKCTIYSIGLFQSMENMPEKGRDAAQFFKLCACDWASSKNHFYDVKDPADLEFVFGQVAGNIVKRTGTFSYPGKDKDYSAQYYYDDNYFKSSSYEYNQQLATMSLCLELSAWGSEDESNYTKKMKNAEALLYELGFAGFDHNYTDFTEEGINGKPTKDSVGVVAANKMLSFDGKDYTLIAVAVRGGGYEREWASNFTIGVDGDHQGFSEAKNNVILFLENYIKEQRISGDIKLWLVGYSRAAATANLTAGAIDDGKINLGSCNLELKDMFAYTFETPAGTVNPKARDKKYSNIFNIINLNDPVPRVAPNAWEFGRYGSDQYISTPEKDGVDVYKENLAAMLARYQELDGYEGYIIDDFKMKIIKLNWNPITGFLQLPSIVDNPKDNTPQSEFLNSYITLLAKDFVKNRSNYVAKYQNEIRYACGIFFGADPAKTDKLFNAVNRKFCDNWGLIIWELLRPFGGEKAAYEKIAQYLRECLDEAEITNYSQDEFDAAAKALLDLVAAVATNHPHLATTFVSNIEGIKRAHYPELCLAWMQSMDENYTTDAGLSFSTGKYRIVRINCPIDVTVYDAEGNELASIIDDTPQPDSHVVVSFNDEGEKLVYLPVYNDYVIKLVATDDGVMNYAVQEYDSYAGETNHMFLFNDIEITKGQEYTAYLPSFSEEDIESMTGTAADTDYSLFLGAEQILCSEELKDEEVFNAYYDVDASTEDTEKGFVFGSGIRQYGTFAMVTAIAYEGYECAGWYQGGKLVSTEEEYRFRVSEDIELTAVFRESTKEETPDKKPEEGTGEGTGDGSDDGKDDGKDNNKDDGKEEGTGDTENDGRKGNIEGAFRVVSNWNTGFTGEITLTNTTDEVIHNWVVAFDLPYELRGIWNGEIVSYENGVYTIQNAGYNWDIEPGESVTFGFYTYAETETIIEPTYYTLIEKPAQTVQQKYEIAYKVNSDWKTAFNGQIEISNVSSGEIFDWTLEFDSVHNFDQFWNAEIVSHEGNHYVIKNRGYNAAIEAGQTLILGFTASCGSAGSGYAPMNYKLTTVNMNRAR
ncbi:MAG: cellulose binding domain-containing protein [Acetatifactor sp.]|nr:cellulose binding domain-containing protein [Acetatifactor sp.]